MADAIWKGHISFGLITIPISIYSAEKHAELHFHFLDSRNQARVRYERINEETGKQVPWNNIVKALEITKDNYVILDEEDFKHAAPKSTKMINIENFINHAEIDPIYFERPYYLVPDPSAEKGYVLLRETLERTQKIAIAKIVIREKQHLAALLPMKNALILNLLRFQQQLYAPEDFSIPGEEIETYNITLQELKMAEELINNRSQKWAPEKYHDDYQAALFKWINKKISESRIKKTNEIREETPSSKTTDFMLALKRSLQNVKRKTSKL